MKYPFLQNIEKNIEEVVKEYRQSPSEELYQKWLKLLGQYSQKHDQQRTVRKI
jgi:hypothetical protein